MALLFADSFDHYGSGSNGGARMLSSGAYSQGAGNSNFAPASTIPGRTGPLALYSSTGSTLNTERLIAGPHQTVGVGYAFYQTTLRTSSGMMMRGAGNTVLIGVRTNLDGSLSVVRNNTTLATATVIAMTAPGVISSSAWHHVELKVTIDEVAGAFELRINGETELAMSNINLGNTHISRVALTNGNNSEAFDDLIVWNDQGDAPNNFVGPARVITTFPDADTAVADFTINGAANGYQCINQIIEDGDTTYIEGVNPNDASEFELGTLPPETEGIVGVFIPALAKLSDAGTGDLKVSIMSGASEAVGFNGPLTQAYTYRDSSFSVDPDTGSAWNKSALEAARLRFEKTA